MTVYQEIRNILEGFSGNVSVLCKNLDTSETLAWNIHSPHEAASIIKLYLMAAIFQGFEDGDFSPEQRLMVRREDCVPSCGVLTYLDDGEEKTYSLRDLVELMIIVSDNTACNLLFEFYGQEKLQSFITDRLGCAGTFFRRKMFDEEKARLGLNNYTTAADTAALLEKIYRGELVSEKASAQMLQILRHQRLNGKIPFYLHTLEPIPQIAHKTGEDDGMTHDVGIIYGTGRSSLLVCFMGNEVDVPAFEQAMALISLKLYNALPLKETFSAERLILASASPRRSELLKKAGLAFQILPSDADETTSQTEPARVVMALSAQKAEAVLEKLGECRENTVILSADTIVCCEGRILGKPADEEEAVQMLTMLQGRTHQVYTGVAVSCLDREGKTVKNLSFTERTDVEFYPVPEEEIRAYAAGGEPMDKAGSYAIQGSWLVHVKGIRGDYSNVVGLPVARIFQECRTAGIRLPRA